MLTCFPACSARSTGYVAPAPALGRTRRALATWGSSHASDGSCVGGTRSVRFGGRECDSDRVRGDLFVLFYRRLRGWALRWGSESCTAEPGRGQNCSCLMKPPEQGGLCGKPSPAFPPPLSRASRVRNLVERGSSECSFEISSFCISGRPRSAEGMSAPNVPYPPSCCSMCL